MSAIPKPTPPRPSRLAQIQKYCTQYLWNVTSSVYNGQQDHASIDAKGQDRHANGASLLPYRPFPIRYLLLSVGFLVSLCPWNGNPEANPMQAATAQWERVGWHVVQYFQTPGKLGGRRGENRLGPFLQDSGFVAWRQQGLKKCTGRWVRVFTPSFS